MKKENRYKRVLEQIEKLTQDIDSPLSRMATINAVLFNKMDNFFWTGFYLLENEELLVGPYQGPLACLQLKKDTGVCWSAINKNQNTTVPDVDKFPGHIACDSRSKSEIVILLRDKNNKTIGVLDVDSNILNNFDEIDEKYLEKIVRLVYE